MDGAAGQAIWPAAANKANHMDVHQEQHRLWARQDGATSIEYALVAALITAVIALTVSALGGKTGSMFQTAASLFP